MLVYDIKAFIEYLGRLVVHMQHCYPLMRLCCVIS